MIIFFAVNKSAVAVPPPAEAPEAAAIGFVSLALTISVYLTIFVLDIVSYTCRNIVDKHKKAVNKRCRKNAKNAFHNSSYLVEPPTGWVGCNHHP